MMQTLIGADGVVMTLGGRIEIYGEESTVHGYHFESTIIHSYPGTGIKLQRIVLNRPCILDVETLPEIDYANYPKPKNPALLQHFGIAPQDLADRWG